MPTIPQHKKDIKLAIERIIRDYRMNGYTTFDLVETIKYAAQELIAYDPTLLLDGIRLLPDNWLLEDESSDKPKA